MTPFVDDPDFTLYVGDARAWLAQLEPVDAIVTSPPYAGQRGAVDPDEYVFWIAPYLAALRRVLKPGGSMMLNLGRTFRDGEESPYIERTLFAARELGWKRIDTIIWHKPNGHPFGAPQYLLNRHELVYWLALDVNAYRGYDETRRPPAPETIARRERAGKRGPKNRERGEYEPKARTNYNPDGIRPSSVFECYVGREKGIKHGEPMALELAEHLVALACPPGGTVLDLFAGAGTTAVAARRLGRSCVGIELRQEAAEECAARLSQQELRAA